MEQSSEKNAFLYLLDLATRHFAWIAFIIYASGFWMWNFYLSHYGFFEYNLVETRFLSAGLLIWFPIVLVSVLAVLFLQITPYKRKYIRTCINYFAAGLIGLWLVLFFIFFPDIPQALGGAKPIALSIIGTPTQIAYLADFGVRSTENAQGEQSVQTYPVCLIYQNDQYVLFFNFNQGTSTSRGGSAGFEFLTRVISISREQVLGFQEILSPYSDTVCGLSSSLYDGVVQIPTLH